MWTNVASGMKYTAPSPFPTRKYSIFPVAFAYILRHDDKFYLDKHRHKYKYKVSVVEGEWCEQKQVENQWVVMKFLQIESYSK